MSTRRDRRRLETQDRILEAAEALFEAQGYEQTKVTQICERADLAYGTFFNHFPEKKDVLRQLAVRSVGEVAAGLEELAKQPGELEELLVALFEGAAESFLALSSTRRELVGLIQTIAYAEAGAESDRRFHSAFEGFLAEGVARGKVRSDFPVATLADVLASTFGSLSLSFTHFDDFPIRERSTAAARFLAATLRPREAG
jgi:AcrR family transcriptional regulator